jgi:hypothetical protein
MFWPSILVEAETYERDRDRFEGEGYEKWYCFRP